MQALTCNHLCYTDIASKRVKRDTKASCRTQCKSFMWALRHNKCCHTDRLKACKTQHQSITRALPRNQLWRAGIASKCVKRNATGQCGHSRATNLTILISTQSLQNILQKLRAGTPVRPTLVHEKYRLKPCKSQCKSSLQALPRNQLCCTDIA